MNNKWELTLETLWKQSRFTSYFYQAVQLVEQKNIPTFALTITGSRFFLYYNPSFIESLDINEIIGLLVHEMLHIMLNHVHRTNPGEDLYLQNLAQDMTVNSLIKSWEKIYFSRRNSYSQDIPKLILPEGLPVIPQLYIIETGKKDPTWEELYTWLKDKPRESLLEMKGGEKPDGSMETYESKIAEQLHQVLSEKDILPEMQNDQSVMVFDQMRGLMMDDMDGNNLPTGMHIIHNPNTDYQIQAKKEQNLAFCERDKGCSDERAFQEINGIIKKIQKKDISSWKHQIKSIVDYSSQSNEWIYTYSRFNRRYFSNGIYAPGRIFKEQEILTVAVDVSASMVMKPHELEAAFGVIEDLLDKYRIHLICIDEELFIPRKEERTLARSNDLSNPFIYTRGDWKLIRTGSSGTTFFKPLFNDFMKHHSEMLIVITDGYIYDLHDLKKYTPTTWIISGNRPDLFNAPFGQTVEIGE